jgi:hypothetical protein
METLLKVSLDVVFMETLLNVSFDVDLSISRSWNIHLFMETLPNVSFDVNLSISRSWNIHLLNYQRKKLVESTPY